MGPMKSTPHFVKGSTGNIVINLAKLMWTKIAHMLAIVIGFVMVHNILVKRWCEAWIIAQQLVKL
jgi:hypothetical protein